MTAPSPSLASLDPTRICSSKHVEAAHKQRIDCNGSQQPAALRHQPSSEAQSDAFLTTPTKPSRHYAASHHAKDTGSHREPAGGSCDADSWWDEVERMEEGFSPTKFSVADRYVLGDVIGEGASCEVRTARDRQTGETWACKVVPMPFDDELYGQRVPDWMATSEETRNEAELARRLCSSYVVSCREYFEERGNLYLILDPMSGGDLQDELVRLGNFTEDEARQAFLPMMWGLAHLHSQGVAHRDLNLENVLLESPRDLRSAKLSDFGMARKATPLDPFRTVCGSAHYVAPEVLSGSGVYDVRCDMWSAGVCLFAMLSGYLPFDSDSLPQLIAKVSSGDVDFSDTCWSLISPQAKDLVMRLLAVDPDHRLGAEEVMQHPWMLGKGCQ